MRIYLDNCCFNRPYDEQASLTVRLETEAKLAIQEMIKAGTLMLGWSYILDFENNANPFLEKMLDIQEWKSLADAFARETPDILAMMNRGIASGLKPLDALHIACAVSLNCQYFLTVDKGILKKAALFEQIRIMNPIDFMRRWEEQHEN